MATATVRKPRAKKIAKPEVAIDPQAFQKFLSAVTPDAKRGIIEDLTNLHIEVIPTGMLGLDIATGVGGFPVGRIVELYGMESCGKSTLVYHLTAQAQKLGFLPVMIESEGSIDRRYMRNIGIDLSSLAVFSPNNMEAALDFVEVAAKTAKEQGMKALVMLDSVAALAPEVMMEASAEQRTRAQAASLWSQQMPKVMTTLRRNDATLILINQMRASMDIYSPPSTPGGKAIKFAASLRVMMRSKKIKPTDKDSLDGILGQQIFFTIDKNKVSSPGRKGLALLPPGGKPVDPVQDVFERSVERGVIEENVVFSDGELADRKGYFTIILDDALEAAVAADIKRADKANAELPGTKKSGPYLTTEHPISTFRASQMLEVLAMAPNLVDALRKKVMQTLVDEQEYEEDPFAARLAERVREFDADSEDGLNAEAIDAAREANKETEAADAAAFASAASKAAEEAAAEDEGTAAEDDETDEDENDMSEFDR